MVKGMQTSSRPKQIGTFEGRQPSFWRTLTLCVCVCVCVCVKECVCSSSDGEECEDESVCSVRVISTLIWQ